MRLRIASRKSDLARLQAYSVGEALKAQTPKIEIEYLFRESLGDKNLQDPLWQMPEKGVFTQDFYEDLVRGKADLVVHSWKDLPVENRPGTQIAATLPRADARDLFLLRRDRWQKVGATKSLKVFSSSPRRAYNLENFFKEALPTKIDTVVFEPVRGNVPTRIQKLLDQDADGLVVAKAAIDRLLGAPQEEFKKVQSELRHQLAQCYFMILPLTQNPAAAAQGALAIEISDGRRDLKELLSQIHCQVTFASVQKERARLKEYGGGCHQKVGVTVLSRPFGEITLTRAFTDAGLKVDRVEFVPSQESTQPPAQKENIFPLNPQDGSFFDRVAITDFNSPDTIETTNPGPLWIARGSALPPSWQVPLGTPVWVSGLETWRSLAKRGVWVTGSSESLGESEDPRLDILLNRQVNWTKLTHDEGFESTRMKNLATYKLVPKKNPPSLEGKTHFYWMSGSAFEQALKIYPGIKKGYHACGPGNTYEILKRHLEPEKIKICLSHGQWLSEV